MSRFHLRISCLFGDLLMLESLEFLIYVVNRSAPVCQVVFSDASQKANGFVGYIVRQKSSEKLIFNTSKMAHLLSRTLPNLELLSVYLVIKCLLNSLKTYSNIVICNISIAVDTQIVLSWVLSYTLKTKNQFVMNRLKDIKPSVGVMKERHCTGYL